MDDLDGLCLEPKLYTRDITKAEKAKQNRILDLTGGDVTKSRSLYLGPILDRLTPDDVRCLIRAEDELSHLTHFSRIFPTQDTHR